MGKTYDHTTAASKILCNLTNIDRLNVCFLCVKYSILPFKLFIIQVRKQSTSSPGENKRQHPSPPLIQLNQHHSDRVDYPKDKVCRSQHFDPCHHFLLDTWLITPYPIATMSSRKKLTLFRPASKILVETRRKRATAVTWCARRRIGCGKSRSDGC